MSDQETVDEIARTERLAALLTGKDWEAAQRYIADLKRAALVRSGASSHHSETEAMSVGRSR